MKVPHEPAARPRNRSSVRLPAGGMEQIVALVFKEASLSIAARLLLIWAAQTHHESITVGKIFDRTS